MQKAFNFIDETAFHLKEEDIRRYLIDNVRDLQADFVVVGKEFSVLNSGRIDVLLGFHTCFIGWRLGYGSF